MKYEHSELLTCLCLKLYNHSHHFFPLTGSVVFSNKQIKFLFILSVTHQNTLCVSLRPEKHVKWISIEILSKGFSLYFEGCIVYIHVFLLAVCFSLPLLKHQCSLKCYHHLLISGIATGNHRQEGVLPTRVHACASSRNKTKPLNSTGCTYPSYSVCIRLPKISKRIVA